MFFEDADRRLYLDLLQYYAARFDVQLLGYCLMRNHVHHLPVPPTKESLSNLMQNVHREYAKAVNPRFGWTGHLCQDRFFASPIDDNEYFWTALHYIELNPVRAGIVTHASEYAWSSAQGHCDLRDDSLLTARGQWKRIISGNTDWMGWLSHQYDPARILDLQERIKRSLPWGSDEFVKQIEAETGQCLQLRKPGRPPGTSRCT